MKRGSAVKTKLWRQWVPNVWDAVVRKYQICSVALLLGAPLLPIRRLQGSNTYHLGIFTLTRGASSRSPMLASLRKVEMTQRRVRHRWAKYIDLTILYEVTRWRIAFRGRFANMGGHQEF